MRKEQSEYMKIIKEFIVRDIAGECVLVPTGATTQEFNGLITLTDTARFIWENLEKVDSTMEMAALLAENYEIDVETAAKDTYQFVAQLLQAGFIQCTKEDKTW